MNNPPGFVDDDNLVKAIGLVTRESALVDELFREMIVDLLGPSGDKVWILFEGQTSEWLAETLKEIIKHVDPNYRTWDRGTHAKLIHLVGELAPLRRLRNCVVHGVWMDHSAAYEDWPPRPWGDVNDGTPIYFCYRSKMRNEPEVREFSVGDVELVAKKIIDVRSRLVSTFCEMALARGGPPRRPLARW